MISEAEIPRWRRRFDNYRRAFALLREAIETIHRREVTQLEREGIIQRFEYCWELAWKLIADYLAFDGVIVTPVGPRPVLKAAYEGGYIADGPQWMRALDARNKMAHTYDFATFEKVISEIADSYLDLFDALYEDFLSRSIEAGPPG